MAWNEEQIIEKYQAKSNVEKSVVVNQPNDHSNELFLSCT